MTPADIIKDHYKRIGKRGGQSRSKAKVAAAQRNGKRPKRKSQAQSSTQSKPKH